jgi:hypothetical protein
MEAKMMGEKDKTWNLNVNLGDFPRDTLMEIKNMNDKNRGTREWLANVYYKDGKYILGSPVTGDYSGVSMKPDEQAVKDNVHTGVKECMDRGLERNACKRIMSQQGAGRSLFGTADNKRFGVTQEDLVATVHLHPIRPWETTRNKKIRSQFSGTDIGSEFAKAVRDGKEYRMFLTYPNREGTRQRNMLKLLKFPGKKCMDIMKTSNPHLSDEQIMSIDTDGKNIEIVDWYAYQDESKKRGYLQEVDIENKTGAEAYRAMGNYYTGFIVVGAVATLAFVWYLNRKRRMSGKR